MPSERLGQFRRWAAGPRLSAPRCGSPQAFSGSCPVARRDVSGHPTPRLGSPASAGVAGAATLAARSGPVTLGGRPVAGLRWGGGGGNARRSLGGRASPQRRPLRSADEEEAPLRGLPLRPRPPSVDEAGTRSRRPARPPRPEAGKMGSRGAGPPGDWKPAPGHRPRQTPAEPGAGWARRAPPPRPRNRASRAPGGPAPRLPCRPAASGQRGPAAVTSGATPAANCSKLSRNMAARRAARSS